MIFDIFFPSEVTHWQRRINEASKISCPAASCRALAELAFKLSTARGMQPSIRETILEGLTQRFQQDYIFASELFAEMGLQMTEAFDVVPLPQVTMAQAHVKHEPATSTADQAEVKKEIEEGIGCVAAALKAATAE